MNKEHRYVIELIKPHIINLVNKGWNDPDYIARQITDDFVRQGSFKKYKDEQLYIAHVVFQTFIEELATGVLIKKCC